MDDDPVKKVVFSDGMFQRFSLSGALNYFSGYNPEEFRIDLMILGNLITIECDTCNMDKRSDILQSLENSGLDYQIEGDDYLVIEKELNDPYLSKVKRLIDLKTGLTQRSAIYRKDGQFDSVHLSTYKLINGFPVKTHIVSYYFGQVNGNWQAKTVTYTDRNNIKVYLKQKNGEI